MALPFLAAQQEINRKILQDIQLKRQLIKNSGTTLADLNNLYVGISASINQMPTTQVLSQNPEYAQSAAAVTVPRSVFNPNSSTTTGYFLPQDSHYGNSFIPVLPRMEVTPPNQNPK